jgi:hypothetical protein
VEFIAGMLKWLETTPFSLFILESEWAFPTIEAIHVIAIALVVGTIAIIDLRLLGLASTRRGVAELCREVLPWTWGAFAVAVSAGFLMFISHATDYFGNTPFRIKMLLMGFAGLNMLYFHVVTCRDLTRWDRDAKVPVRARLAGGVSLSCWIAIVIFGRWIGFTMS